MEGGGLRPGWFGRAMDRLAFHLCLRWYLRRIGFRHGAGCRFIRPTRATFGAEPYMVRLGDRVTVTEGVRFITHDGGVAVLRGRYPELDLLGPIAVGSNVFLGMNTLVLPGAAVGDDCVIGAGSVVTGALPPRGVYAGVPARRLKDLDEYEAQALRRGLMTKGLAPGAKQAAWLAHCAAAKVAGPSSASGAGEGAGPVAGEGGGAGEREDDGGAGRA